MTIMGTPHLRRFIKVLGSAEDCSKDKIWAANGDFLYRLGVLMTEVLKEMELGGEMVGVGREEYF